MPLTALIICIKSKNLYNMIRGLGFGFAMFKGLRVNLRVFAEELYVFQMRWRSDVRLFTKMTTGTKIGISEFHGK